MLAANVPPPPQPPRTPPPPPLNGATAQRWRLRAPAAALYSNRNEWSIFSARFMSSTTCENTTAIVLNATVLEGLTASGTLCTLSPTLCNRWSVNGPRNAFVGDPGTEQSSGISSAWRGRQNNSSACSSGSSTYQMDCDVWIAVDFLVPTYVGCIQLYQPGESASRIVVEIRNKAGAWDPVLETFMAATYCADTSAALCCPGTTSADRWGCSYVEAIPLVPFPPPALPPPLSPLPPLLTRRRPHESLFFGVLNNVITCKNCF